MIIEILRMIHRGARAARKEGFLQESQVTPERVEAARQLGIIAKERGQSLSQMALAWLLTDKRVTSVIIGTRTLEQLKDNLATLDNIQFSEEETMRINHIISNPVLWF